MINNKALGNRIKELREGKDITQLELAELIGKSLSSTQKYEQGYTTIPIDILDKIADVLGFELSINFIAKNEQKK